MVAVGVGDTGEAVAVEPAGELGDGGGSAAIARPIFHIKTSQRKVRNTVKSAPPFPPMPYSAHHRAADTGLNGASDPFLTYPPGDHLYTLANVPPMSVARSESESRSVTRKDSTPCS